MDNVECTRSCVLKRDLQKSKNKLGFLKANWPSFNQLEEMSLFTEKDLNCLLCLLNTLIDALANDECWCSNRDIIRLVMTRTLVENTICLRQLQTEVDSLLAAYSPSSE